MVVRRVKILEGQWMGVPLRDNGFATGVVARSVWRRHMFLGYFFGPRRDAVASLDEVSDLTSRDAVCVCVFGSVGFQDETWPLIGTLPEWDRNEWPMPRFLYNTPSGARRVWRYYDETSLEFVREEIVPKGEEAEGPRDGVYGSGAVEIVLTRLLNGLKEL